MRTPKVAGKKKLNVSVQLPTMVWLQFKDICTNTGTSINYCLERVLRDVINQGEIPGVASMDAHTEREQEKFGESAVPTYDGEPNKKSSMS